MRVFLYASFKQFLIKRVNLKLAQHILLTGYTFCLLIHICIKTNTCDPYSSLLRIASNCFIYVNSPHFIDFAMGAISKRLGKLFKRLLHTYVVYKCGKIYTKRIMFSKG